MTIFKNSVGKKIPSLEKFDEMVDGIERAQTLVEFATSTKILELSEAVQFRYFSTLHEILAITQKLSNELRKDMAIRAQFMNDKKIDTMIEN